MDQTKAGAERPNAQHTPGPWKCDMGDIIGRGRKIAQTFDDSGAPYIAPRAKSETHPKVAEQMANARLLAAAPALLAACHAALDALTGCAVPAGGVDDQAALLDAQQMLRAAIRAAEERRLGGRARGLAR